MDDVILVKPRTEPKRIICIVAFSDIEDNSIAYKKFTDVEQAIEFYKKQLMNDNVNVISTRKTISEKK